MSKFSQTFTRTVSRLMTPEEAEERAKEMQLDPELVAWLKKEFVEIHDYRDERERDEGRDFDEELGVGENGRAAMGQSWDTQYSMLAEAMGFDDAWPDEDFCKEHPEVERVWNAFFQE